MKDKNSILKHWFWLLLAAWVYTLTFVFNHYWSKYASYKSVSQSFQKLVAEKEKAFADWAEDTALVHQLASGQVDNALLSEVQQNPFSVFIYARGNGSDPKFWSTNAVLPGKSDVLWGVSGSFKKYGNGKCDQSGTT